MSFALMCPDFRPAVQGHVVGEGELMGTYARRQRDVTLPRMSALLLLSITALSLGALHSFAPDHLAAVSVFVSRRPSWRHALGLGVRWGVGHSLTILVLGAIVAGSGLQLPVAFSLGAERVVGLTLIVLGAMAIVRAQRLHAHVHVHADGTRHWHPHSHALESAHDHSHGTLLGIGMLHGLAGTGALVVALPALAATSLAHSVLFLAVFGIGTVIAMALFGAAAGWALSGAARVSNRAVRIVASLAGAASVIIGAWWLVAAGA